jgi:hypothetical protein
MPGGRKDTSTTRRVYAHVYDRQAKAQAIRDALAPAVLS